MSHFSDLQNLEFFTFFQSNKKSCPLLHRKHVEKWSGSAVSTVTESKRHDSVNGNTC